MAGAAIAATSADSGPPIPNQDRQTVRCYHCQLVQYIPSSRNCRRCHHPLDPPPIQFPIINPVPKPAVSRSAARQQLFINIDRALPVVMFWLRVRKGLSQRQLGNILGVPRTYLSKIESGESLPTVESVVKISAALGTDVRMVMKSCEMLMKK
jgi:DNA-binding XRE family transcriptional regulator